MTRGKIYFIGGGPGDPDLVTVRGLGILKGARLVLAPGHFRESFAGLLAGKESFDPFDYHHKELVAKVDAYLDRGEDAAEHRQAIVQLAPSRHAGSHAERKQNQYHALSNGHC